MPLEVYHKYQYIISTCAFIHAHPSVIGFQDGLVKQGITTKNAGQLLASVVEQTNRVQYDVSIAKHFMQLQLLAEAPLAAGRSGDILPASALPSLTTVYMLDAVVAKVQVSLDDLFAKAMSETDPQKAMMVAQDLLPATLSLIETYTVYIRYCRHAAVINLDLHHP